MSVEEIDIDKFLAHSGKIATEDLDWDAAKRAGLTREECFVLTYFADVEGQTIFYLRDLLNTKASQDPDTTAFLTMWNYEEFFHGRTLARLLAECGAPLERRRVAEVRAGSQFSETLLAWGARLVSKLLPDQFLALYMTWGALNELTTLRGYEQICALTQNPVLRELAERIAKQERKHFAWYFNNAQERLTASASARWFVRRALRRLWTPVGAGVKSDTEVLRVLAALFSGEDGFQITQGIDEKITTLPGLAGLTLMVRYALKAAQRPISSLLPETATS